MKLLKCNRCGYSTNLMTSFKKHMERKRVCKPRILVDVTEAAKIPLSPVPYPQWMEEDVVETIEATTTPQLAQEIQTSKNTSQGYVYMLQEREFIRMKEPVYKVGKTTQELYKRISQYPKSSLLLVAMRVEDCHHSERQLLAEFRKLFASRRDIGAEYFEGDVNEMVKMFTMCVTKAFKNLYDKE